MESEIWRDIPNYEGHYKASNLGRIFSVKSNKLLNTKVSKGYSRISLHKDGVKHSFLTHRIIIHTFHGESGLQVDHINGIKTDNRLDNLRYATTRENSTYYFEKVVLKLLKKMGYGDFIETSKSGDGGIDGIINEDKLGLDKIYIQAKRFNENKVREKDIRNFIGAMSGDTNKGVFVTTSLFDKGAEEKAKNAHHKIILIDGNKLVDLMHEFNVGVQIKQTYEVKQLDEDFFMEQ